MRNSSVPIVRLVDDDVSVLKAQRTFLEMADHNVICYASALEFLEKDDFSIPGCVVLDVRMPKMTGIELQQEMKRRNIDLPVIFLSAHGDIEMAVKAVHEGAKTFLVKPPQLDKLLETINAAIEENKTKRREKNYGNELVKIWNTLTPAETSVAKLVAKGLQNARIAEILGVSERTIRSQRAQIYDKLDIENAVELCDFVYQMNQYGEMTDV